MAQRRLPRLVAAGADVLVIAPAATPAVEAMATAGEIAWERRPYVGGDLDGAWYVLACTSDPTVNAAVAAEADRRRAFCVRADDAAGGTAATAPAAVAKPYDPSLPIDLSGTPGVTPQQQAAAENLIAVTLVELPQWSDYRVAEAAGFKSIGDGATGLFHEEQQGNACLSRSRVGGAHLRGGKEVHGLVYVLRVRPASFGTEV